MFGKRYIYKRRDLNCHNIKVRQSVVWTGCVCAAVFLVQPAEAKLVLATQATLARLLETAQPGDTLVLLPGGYGVIAFPARTWATPITINAQLASMSGVVFSKTRGVVWNGGSLIGKDYGMHIRDSANITIASADITGAARGIVISDSTDIKITGNRLHGLRSDGIDIVGQRVLVEANTIEDMRPIQGDHPDGIQMWSVADFPTRDIVVRNNTITGAMQGIFARSEGLGVNNLSVTGNKVTVDYSNGIALLDTSNSVATGNTVRSRRGSPNKANMRVIGANNTVCGNAVPDVPYAPAAQPCAR